MSILIKGAKMPEHCRGCHYEGFLSNCRLTGQDIEDVRGDRPTWCPIVEIKTPHGRLIDADAFLATVRPICEEDSFAACTLKTVKQLIINKINEFPAIIPADGGAENG